jgi:pyroglutamyl-peptidase
LLEVPKLLEKHQPDVVIHIGLDSESSYYAIEKGAEKDKYHEIPDEARKVVSRAEAKKLWGKSPPRLDSTLDIEDILIKWKENTSLKTSGKGKSKGKGEMEANGSSKEVDLRTSDCVGNYVCGFVYYTSLEWFWKKNGPQGERKVLFLHVPMLEGKEDFEKGKDITVALIKGVIGSCQL